MIETNLQEVHEKIKQAAIRSKRDPKDIHLIAVSKTMPIEDLKTAYACGQRLFGENKAQEVCEKFSELPEDIEWHFIGHLQRNKVKNIIDKVTLIHSVDSFRLAQEIDKEAKKRQKIMDILLEVNVAKEETKFGISLEEVEDLVRQIAELSHVRVRGLMTIAPYVGDAEENRTIFCDLHQIFVDISNKSIHNISMDILSMGMTNDYEVAVEEGATHVRVGTGIFGKRSYMI